MSAATAVRTASRVALITGAGRGIGRAIALRLADDGLNVALNDLPSLSSELNQVKADVESRGVKCTLATADVSQQKEVYEMVERTVAHLGQLDVMVANAGIARIGPLLQTSMKEFDAVMNVNVKGVFLCYQEAAKQMIKQGTGGKIIGAASIVAYRPFPLLSPYSASKWAVRGLTQGAAMEWAKYGITVNSYCPGIVDTAMWEKVDRELAPELGMKQGEVIKKYVHDLTALGRTSQPEDVAKF
ncbi:unnamed protein product, partial [Didymodactylos carnosus]